MRKLSQLLAAFGAVGTADTSSLSSAPTPTRVGKTGNNRKHPPKAKIRAKAKRARKARRANR